MGEEVKKTKKSKAVAPLESMMNKSIDYLTNAYIKVQAQMIKCASTKEKEHLDAMLILIEHCLQDINAMKEHCVSRNKF